MTVGDTIVAQATPAGRGGIAVVRLSGPSARSVAATMMGTPVDLVPRLATFVRLAVRGRQEGVRDEAIATFFPAESSYTGEDVVELSTHGSPVIVRSVVNAAVAAGARLARPGEFTLRAFLNGRLDLTQAEAVRDLVEATTERQARIAYDQLRGTLGGRVQALSARLFELEGRLEASVDFPEEGYHFVDADHALQEVRGVLEEVRRLLNEERVGRAVREGVLVAIVGPPNAGKSTLFNRLAGRDRAIVTEVAGTTRDVLSERLDVGGLAVDLVDTAGLREVADAVEQEGVRRAIDARDAADLVLFVADGSQAPSAEVIGQVTSLKGRDHLVLLNKVDLGSDPGWVGELGTSHGQAISVSASTGQGVEEVEAGILRSLGGTATGGEEPAVSNARHAALLGNAAEVLERLEASLSEVGELPEELVLSELRTTRDCLDEVTGRRTTDDLLELVFSRFCIGK